MKKMVLTLGIAAAMASNAYGVGQVWYSGVGNNPASSVLSSGPGQSLALECDKTLGQCSWDVTVVYDTADGGQTGWALDLFGDPNKFQVTNALATANPISAGGTTPGAPGQAFGTPGFDPNILWGDISGFNAAPPAGAGTYNIMTFTLSTIGPVGPPTLYSLNAWIGGNAFGGNDDLATGNEIVQIGPNPPMDGGPTGVILPGPVITVNNIPEPATLSLLALGGLALIRRRK
jgi:hypothetical protein